MHSIYFIAVYWSIWALWVSVATLRLIHKTQTKASQYTKYQNDQLRRGNQRLRELAAARAAEFHAAMPAPAGLSAINVTDSEGNTYTLSGFAGMTSYTGPAATTPMPTGAAAPRKRRTSNKPKRTTKKKEEPMALIPVPSDSAFYDEPRME